MLLIAFICQLASDPEVESLPVTGGAILLEGRFVGSKPEWDSLSATQAINEDPVLKTLWLTPVARVNGEVVAVQDVLYHDTEKLLNWRESSSPDQFAYHVQQLIEAKLPNTIRKTALWTAVRQEYPQELFDESWKRHEQAWANYAETTAKKRSGARSIPDSWKPYWIRYYVIQDYLDVKFGPVPQLDTSKSFTTLLSSRKLQVEEFQKDSWRRAKVETAYLLRESPTKLRPGEVVRPRLGRVLAQ